MRCLALTIALFGALPACKKDQSGPTVVATDTADDAGAMVEVDFGYEAKGDREIDLIVNLRAIGVEQLDKLVVQVEIGDFHIRDGSARWTGFVPPRDPQKHVVRLVAVEGVDSPSLTVTVSRSLDSQMLINRTLQFVVEDGRVKSAE